MRALWEVRSGREHFTHSKAMAWLAFDRAIRSAVMFKLAGPMSGMVRHTRPHPCRRLRARLRSRSRSRFVRAYGSKELDASLLLLPAIGFLPAHDPRIVATIAAIERRLLVDGLVLRYDTRDRSRWSAGGRGCLSCLQLLARRCLSHARPPRRSIAPVQPSFVAAQ